MVNEGTRYLARCLAGAILSIVVISYHAAWKGTKSDLISVAWAGLFTNVVWLATSVNKYYLSKAKPTFFNKVDMTVCGSFAALFAYALYVS